MTLLRIACIECLRIFHVGSVNKLMSKIEEDERGLRDAGVTRQNEKRTEVEDKSKRA